MPTIKLSPTNAVEKHVNTRKLSLEEFRFFAKQIEIDPFETLRFLGKTANFSLLFSASAKTFADSSLTQLVPAEASQLVETLNLRGLQKQLISKGKIDASQMKDQYFMDRLALATYIREEFQKSYRGLVDLANERRGEAVKKGYVRTTHGAVRRLPEMLLSGKHDKGNRELFTLFSIAINSPVQNFESVIVNRYTGVRLWEWMLENDFKTYIFNFVHDSCDLYILKEEAQPVLAKIKEFAEEQRPEYGPVYPTVSGFVGDYYGNGDLWKDGEPMEAFL